MNQKFQKIKEAVEKELSCSAHNIDHLMRVYNLSLHLAENEDVDLDVSAFMLQCTGAMKLQAMEHVIFFNNMSSSCGSVKLSGDSRDGKNGDIDEEVFVDVTKIPENVNAVAIYINIFKPAIA